jgi:hypothetical protein
MIRTNLSQTDTSTIHAILPAGIGIDKSSYHHLSQSATFALETNRFRALPAGLFVWQSGSNRASLKKASSRCVSRIRKHGWIPEFRPF